MQLALFMALHGFWWGLALYTVAQGTGFVGLALVSFCVHRSEYGWTEGCEAVVKPKKDFGESVGGGG